MLRWTVTYSTVATSSLVRRRSRDVLPTWISAVRHLQRLITAIYVCYLRHVRLTVQGLFPAATISTRHQGARSGDDVVRGSPLFEVGATDYHMQKYDSLVG